MMRALADRAVLLGERGGRLGPTRDVLQERREGRVREQRPDRGREGGHGRRADAGLTHGHRVPGDEFCNIAVAALASAGDVTKASTDLVTAMTGNDINALHTASQQILDNGTQATHFYTLGATVADDQATKDAFTGLSQFVAQYSVPMGQAGVSAATVPDFTTAIRTLFSDPSLTPLLQNVAGWTQATSAFTKQHCAIS